MKKYLWLLLAVLVLVGCAQQEIPEETPAQTTVPTPTGIYIPESDAERTTAGALLAYDITGKQLHCVENGIAVYNDQQELVVLEGQEGMIHTTVSRVADLRLVKETTVYHYSDMLYAYDWESAQTATWQLPAEMVGDFLISDEHREIYYCTANQIWAMHMDTGISRLIREHSYEVHSLEAIFFGGQVLVWNTDEGVLYISAENGMTLEQQPDAYAIKTDETHYLLHRMDGIIEQWIWGQRQGTPQLLKISALEMVPDFANRGAVALDAEGLFSYYDLNTGKCIAAVKLPQDETCLDMVAHGDFVWILTDQGLYRWDISKSAVADNTNYFGHLWTVDAPDEEALALCRQEAERLSQTYHLPIMIGEDALAAGQGVLELEYQVPALQKMLSELEQCLQQLPEGFLDATVQYGGLSISLVRKVDSAWGYGRYWQGGNCNIAISVYADTRTAFFTGLGGAIETRILGNSRDLEYWDKNNPVSFKYSYSEEAPEEYLPYIPMFFPCELAMTYPTEDRASVFCYAMAENGADAFSSSFMQEKLKLFCEGIREAYDLKNSEEVFPWEQYLKEPLV